MIVQLMEIDISELERVLGSLITDNMVTTCKWFSFYKRTISRELCTDVLAFSDYVSNSYESIIDNTAFYINKQNGYSTYLSGALNEVNFIVCNTYISQVNSCYRATKSFDTLVLEGEEFLALSILFLLIRLLFGSLI